MFAEMSPSCPAVEVLYRYTDIPKENARKYVSDYMKNSIGRGDRTGFGLSSNNKAVFASTREDLGLESRLKSGKTPN